ncbi:zinc knuckle domain-containing protein [Besnoitia besnoiti]|uniref:Branchpoint-bridging protein n=1 Tax=Besnoitia besnoiti TaxID=94643 RepID=A0A2A9MEM1_BESBE|nr:zinc knuckle domain-containing protein [Besnoitia besnoiti]PFH34386.1 zinc knuckle domain-containing protein [Besnoitia besnoiti]
MSMEQLMALVPLEAALAGKEKGGRKSRWERPKPKKKGVSKWGPVDDKDFLPPPYVDLPVGMTAPQMDRFLREQRFDELQRKLAAGDYEFGDPDIRPPSPPPIYDRNGSRINTRDVRVKSAMQAEQQRLTEFMVKHLPGFVPPPDWKPAKKVRRIEIPLDKYPDYNFMGIIIGPRGCNHKRLEAESGTTISVRGRGTQKEGKRDHQTEEEASMPMHVHICGDTEEAVEKALALIEPLLDPLHPAHEEFKKRGLEQLALVNGVNYSDLEARRCPVCQGAGHTAQDCPDAQELQPFKKPEVEYRKMMSELTGDSTLDGLDDPSLARSPEDPGSQLRGSPYASSTPNAPNAATPPPGVSPPSSYDRHSSSPSPYSAHGMRGPGGRIGGPSGVPPPPPMSGAGDSRPGGFGVGPVRGRPGLGYSGRGAGGRGGRDEEGDKEAFMRRGGNEFWRDNLRGGEGDFGGNGPRPWGRGGGAGGPVGRGMGVYPEVIMPPMGMPGMHPPWGGMPPPGMMGPPMGPPGGPDGGGPGGACRSRMGSATGGNVPPNFAWGSGPFSGHFPPPMWGPGSSGGQMGPSGSSAGGGFPMNGVGALSSSASDAGGSTGAASQGPGGPFMSPWGFGAPGAGPGGGASGAGTGAPLPMAPAGAPPPAPDVDDRDDDNMDMND